MSRNKRPCIYCKRRRRKCTFAKNSEDCNLCAQMNVDCIPCDADEEGLPVRDGNQKIQQWQKTITRLDIDLQTMRCLIGCNSDYRHSKKNKKNNNIKSDDDSYSDTTSTTTTTTTNTDYYEWNLSVVNGCIRLDGRIKDIDELLAYNQASIRYLSPLYPIFRQEPIRFNGLPKSIAVASQALVIRYAKPSDKPRHSMIDRDTNKAAITNQFLKQQMDELVSLYMERYNPFVGLIHAPSFLEHYHRTKNALSSPMILAVCIDTIAYFYPRLKYSAEEKRQLAGFFYSRCRDLLLDMYDDPKYRLHAIISTNLVMQYLMELLLDFMEARRLLTMAIVASHEVDLDSLSEIEYAMYQRHRVCLGIYHGQSEIVLYDRYDFTGVNFEDVYPLDDDPPAVVSYLAMYKAVFSLVKTPYVTNILGQLSFAVTHGNQCELSLDTILRFEPTLRVWWETLPEEFQICEDPFDLPSARKALETVTSSTQLNPFAILHVITAVVQSVLLKPHFEEENKSGDNNIIHIIRDKALSMTLDSIQLLVYMMKKHIEVDIEAIPVSFGYMMGILHSVCNLMTTCQHIKLSYETRKTLIHCFYQLTSVIPPNHHIPQASSSLESFVNTLKFNPLSIYEKYPIPKLAMISDIFYTCFGQLGSI
ncbi:hypothetical protein BDA99DRAFT_507317 [Phascolomyces articulosus]|uniref:Zn(2)-C6 fungal-type domain-containing protein n=1 Tax=Phascolomyces articulosus TaxID=60185 RepID=A0AAD5KBW7_9FUNG|nr:hypothetical protein BDA99DRAFT_507317 [Phascolomyces articulosus]